jgi:hydrogenase-4 component E
MTNILLIVFAITLIYIGMSNRLYGFISILAFQGVLLFGVALIELIEIDVVNLIFILFETIVVKTIAVPLFLNYIIKKNNVIREDEPFIPNFLSVVIVTSIILISFLLSTTVGDSHLRKMFFVAALSALFTGLFIITTRRKIITHVMGFLVIENGVFVLSLAVGSEMPMLVNVGILLDIFAGVLLVGLFVNKIGGVFKEQDVDYLRRLMEE